MVSVQTESDRVKNQNNKQKVLLSKEGAHCIYGEAPLEAMEGSVRNKAYNLDYN